MDSRFDWFQMRSRADKPLEAKPASTHCDEGVEDWCGGFPQKAGLRSSH
jgi:hypothetical protein